jgi:hypothetical protein
MATITVTDALQAQQAIEKPLPPGRALAAASKPVVLSTEDLAVLQALVTALTPVDYTLLTASSVTGTPVIIVAGNYTWSAWGTWDGATAQLQLSPDAGTTWIDITDVDLSANGGAFNIPLPAGRVRVVITGAGGATSITSALQGNK